jgi:RimJ/RimL family protein N-acetyltransferase
LDLEEIWRGRYRIPMESRRCSLRPLVADDVEWLTDLLGDPEVTCFLGESAESRDKARRHADAMIYLDQHSLHFGHWAIEDKDTGAIHGWAALGKLRPWWGPSDEIALSYVLRRESWGQGIATEAAGRLVQYAFEVHGLDQVMAVIISGNTASKRVLEKIGMRLVRSAEMDELENLMYFRIDAPGHAATDEQEPDTEP